LVVLPHPERRLALLDGEAKSLPKLAEGVSTFGVEMLRFAQHDGHCKT
jgi:hypothetical protein